MAAEPTAAPTAGSESASAGATVRPFLAFLQEYRNGALHDELSLALNALTAAVRAAGKEGQLALVIDVRPAGRAPDHVFVTAAARTTLPEPDSAESLMFVDQHANLTINPPTQTALPRLRAVSASPTTLTTPPDAA